MNRFLSHFTLTTDEAEALSSPEFPVGPSSFICHGPRAGHSRRLPSLDGRGGKPFIESLKTAPLSCTEDVAHAWLARITRQHVQRALCNFKNYSDQLVPMPIIGIIGRLSHRTRSSSTPSQHRAARSHTPPSIKPIDLTHHPKGP